MCKQLDGLIDWVKCLQIGVKGMVYVKCNEDGSYKLSVDKFYSQEDFVVWVEVLGVELGDLILVLSGEEEKICKQMGELCLEMG